jgi:predicted nucleic acid-binding protein
MTRIYHRVPADTMHALVLLKSGGLQIMPVDGDLGITAGELHARHYDRRKSPLSMADCMALATAMTLGEPLATSDPPLAAAALSEGVVIIGLPDTKGRRPGV